jgi:hypothetical protein
MSNPNPENDKIRARRNLVMALSLVAFVILVFVVTLVKLRGNVSPHF